MENYFILLDWDPDDLDPVKIAAHLEKKKAEWQGQSRQGDGTKAKMAKAALALLPEIKSLLVDHVHLGRAAEDKLAEMAGEARKIRKEQHATKGAELEELIELAARNHFITPAQIARLKKDYGAIFGEAEIDKRLKKLPVRAEEAAGPEQIKPLLASEMKAIAEDLQIAGKKDLFQLLGENAYGFTNATLTEMANKLKADIKRNANKNAITDAKERLAGRAATIFDPKSEEKRKRYEKACELEILKFIDHKIDFIVTNKRLEPDIFDTLVNQGMKAGIARLEVEDYLEGVATKKQIRVYRPMKSTGEQMILCCACRAVNEKGANFCKSCRQPMTILCPAPKCGKNVEAGSRICQHCSFPMGDMPLAQPFLERARHLARGNDPAAADRELTQAEHYWPGHTEVVRLRAELASRAAKVEKMLGEVRELVKQRKLVEAKRLTAAENDKDTRLAQLSKEIATKLREAEALVGKIHQCVGSGDFKTALRSFSELEAMVVDLPEAAAVASLLAPQPPAAASATAANGSVRVKWEINGSTEGVTCVVYRRDISKGEREPKTSFPESGGNDYLDASAEAGRVYEYTVKSRRAGIESRTGATTAPVMAFAELKEVRAVSGDRLVTLSWVAPGTGTSTVIVMKEGSPPTSMSDGKKLTGQNHDGATAMNLQNDLAYHFRIAAVYGAGSGHELMTPGVTVSAVPVAPLSPIKHLELDLVGGMIEAKWQAPEDQGTPGLYHMDSGHGLKLGRRLSVKELSEKGKRIGIDSKSHATFEPPASGALEFVIAVIRGESAVVGAAETIIVEDVRNKEMLIDYSLSRPWLNRGVLELTISARGERVVLPKLLLVQAVHGPPRTAADGKPVLSIEPDLRYEEASTHRIPLSSLQAHEYLGLFLADSSQADRFRIMRPDSKSVKIPG